MALTVGELVAFLRVDKSQYDRGLREAETEAKTAGERTGTGFTRGADGRLRDARGRFVAAGTDAGEGFGEGLGEGLGGTKEKARETADEFGKTFRARMLTAGRIAGLGLVAGLSSGLAVQGTANLVAALAPLLGLLVAVPAVAGAGGVALGTLKLGLAGVGDALKAGIKGDTEKLNKALEKLAPEARAAVREILALKPAFDQVKRAVQGRLFGGMSDEIRTLAGVYLPVLRSELPKVADSLSVFAENFGAAARNGPLLAGVRDIIRSTAVGLAHANDNVGGLTSAFGRLLSVGAPLVERLGTGFATVTGRFAAFIERTASSGQLAGWAEAGIGALKSLWSLLVNLGKLITTVLSAANTTGGSLVSTLAALVGQANDFLRSTQGWAALKAIFGAVAAFGRALGTALGAVLPALAAAFLALAPAVGPLADSLAQVVVAVAPLLPALATLAAALLPQLVQTIVQLTPAFGTLVGWLSGAATWLSQYPGWIMPIVVGIGAMVGVVKGVALAVRLWTAAQILLNIALSANPIGLIVLAVAGLVAAIVYAYTHSEKFRAVVTATWNAIKAAVGAVISWFAGLPAFFSSVWGSITGAVSAAGVAIANAVLGIVGWFRQLPGRILAAIIALPGMLIGFWLSILNGMLFLVGFLIGSIVRFFMTAPGKILAALRALPGLLSSLFTSALHLATSAVSAGVSAVVRFFAALPGRAASAASSLGGRIRSLAAAALSAAAGAVSAGVSAVVRFFAGLPGKAVSALSSLPGAIKGVFSGAGSWLLSAGADILRGLANGIKGAVGAVVQEAKNAASSIVSGFKSAMHIGSPSRVMEREVGAWIPPGIGVGIRKGMPALNRDVRAMLDGLPLDVPAPTVSAPAGAAAVRRPGAGTAELAAQLARLADLQARAELAGVPDVRVFIGDEELTHMIRTEVDSAGRATAGAAYAGAGRRVG